MFTDIYLYTHGVYMVPVIKPRNSHAKQERPQSQAPSFSKNEFRCLRASTGINLFTQLTLIQPQTQANPPSTTRNHTA